MGGVVGAAVGSARTANALPTRTSGSLSSRSTERPRPVAFLLGEGPRQRPAQRPCRPARRGRRRVAAWRRGVRAARARVARAARHPHRPSHQRRRASGCPAGKGWPAGRGIQSWSARSLPYRSGGARCSQALRHAPVTLRSGRQDDAEAVLSLWRAAGSVPGRTDDPGSVRALVAHDPDALVVAEAGGEVVATVIAVFDGWRGSVYRLAVRPDLRRRGVASALVHEAERRLVARGTKRVGAIVVQEDKVAVAFWDSGGLPEGPTRGSPCEEPRPFPVASGAGRAFHGPAMAPSVHHTGLFTTLVRPGCR